MDAIEQYVQLCGEVGHLTESLIGISIVDAYFGSEEFAPKNQQSDTETLVNEMGSLADLIRDEVDSELRPLFLVGEIESLQILMRWLAGERAFPMPIWFDNCVAPVCSLECHS